MKHPDQTLPSQPRTTNDFLLHTPRAATAGEPGVCHDVAPMAIYDAFPDALTGEAFIAHALDRVDPVECFGVLVACFDVPADMPAEEQAATATRGLHQVAAAFDVVCRDVDGSWGQLNDELICGVFPDATAEGCDRLVDRIRRHLKEHHQTTATIGAAVFPTRSFTKRETLDNARKALDHATFFGPDSQVTCDAVSLNISGDRHYQEGDINAAMAEYTAARDMDPANVNVINSLGVCYGVLGAYEKAIKLFQAAVGHDAQEYMAMYNISLACMMMGDPEGALPHCLQAATIAPDVFEIRFQAGRLYVELGNPKKALPHLEKAVSLDNTRGIAHRYLGACLADMKKIKPAVKAYKQAVTLNPNDAESLSALGYLYDQLGENPDITTILCQQSVDIDPENGLYRHRLGELYLKQDMLEAALTAFTEAERCGFDSRRDIESVRERLSTET